MTKRERMAAYREAARRIAEGEWAHGCCDLIFSVANLSESLRFYYSPIRHPKVPFYWWPKSDRDSRVIALLLAAEMVRTGDL